MKTKSFRFAKSEHQMEKQMEKNELKKAKWLLERIRPGQLLLKYFIKSSRLKLDQVAEKLEMRAQDIIELRRITSEFAERCEQRFGWPAKVLLRWQDLYDKEEQYWGEETFAAELKEHVRGQKIFLAHIKSRNEMLKKDRPFVKIDEVFDVTHLKRLLAKLEREGTLEIFWVHNYRKKWSIFGKVPRPAPAEKVMEQEEDQPRA